MVNGSLSIFLRSFVRKNKKFRFIVTLKTTKYQLDKSVKPSSLTLMIVSWGDSIEWPMGVQ